MPPSQEDIETLKLFLEVEGEGRYYMVDDRVPIHYLEIYKDPVTAYNRLMSDIENAKILQPPPPPPKPQPKPPPKPQPKPPPPPEPLSKEKVPSPSSVIDPYDDDLERAKALSLLEDHGEGREAFQFDFDKWVISNDEARRKLHTLFYGKGWSVVNPRGDGFCGLYIAAIDFQNNANPNTDPEVLRMVLEVQRDGLIDLILEGMKKYYEARDRHIALRIQIPDELGDNEYFNIDDRVDEVDEDDNKFLRISPDNFILTHQLLSTNEERIREKLRILEVLSNTPEAVFRYLSYMYNRNYLILSHDEGRDISPFLTTFIPCYADVRLDEQRRPIYPYNDLTNTAVMYNNGHYYLLNNPDTTKKAQLVGRILENKLTDTEPRLWQIIFAKGIIRKRKARTHKGIIRKRKARTHKGRTHKGRTHKGRTHKGRTHRSIRRKAIKHSSIRRKAKK